jgi:hypothetical protein
MSDDLFEFLVVHQMGRAAEVAGRAAGASQAAAAVRSNIDKIKGHKHSECGQRNSGNARLDERPTIAISARRSESPISRWIALWKGSVL